jgi:signal transduction histidine kinase
MEGLATDTIREVRRLSAELRPTVLDDHGLLAAIRGQVGDFEKRTGLRCTLALPAREICWGEERCTAAFRVLQEALTNVMRHARAEKIAVALWQEEQGDAVLEVRDDGCGISAEQALGTGSLGLLGMRERALLHGGTLAIDGVPGGGTTLTLRMPCESAHQGEGV